MFDNDLYLQEMFEAIAHSGVAHDENPPGRGSGRYGYGSGENPFQHEAWYGFYKAREDMRKQGMSEADIMKKFEMTTSEYRRMISITKEEQTAAVYSYVMGQLQNGRSLNSIAKELGKNESTLRSMKTAYESGKKQDITRTYDALKECLEKDGIRYLDIGKGTGTILGVSDEKLSAAVQKLEEEGWQKMKIQVDQLGTVGGEKTTITVLAPKGTTYADIHNHLDLIEPVPMHTEIQNGEKKTYHWERPASVDSSRVQICYAEDGGKLKDGIVELRRGMKDLSLGDDINYAQVRIAVDGTHYIKGMAVYADDLPSGCDIRFNTNKTKDVPMMSDDKNNTVLKIMKSDPDNPFGSSLRMNDAQYHYEDDDGNSKLSPINKVRQEGDWDKWAKTLPAQMLSKQSPELAKRQLNARLDDLQAEYEVIMSMTNPVIKKQQLIEFSEKCDASATDLKAAAMPNQTTKVLFPSTSLKENEIYVPGYENGDKVVCIRYPHGATFEIPELTVNNNNRESKRMIGNAIDGCVVHPKSLAQLSGADCDGDTVTVIKNDGSIQARKAIQELVDFEPKERYKAYPGMPEVGPKKKGGDGFNTQRQMGIVSNLLSDMNVKGAPTEDIIKVLKHSMTVIDAEKHNLNWKLSEEENDIKALKAKWQSTPENPRKAGASTLITRAGSEERVTKRAIWNPSTSSIDPETGEKIYREAKTAHWVDYKTGEEKTRYTRTTKMAETKDARTLYSDPDAPQLIEVVYASYANSCKDLGNKARKSWLEAGNQEYNASAAKTYAAEVASLTEKQAKAAMNSPRERQAQALANAQLKAKKESNPSLKEDKEALKKEKNRLLTEARAATGAHKDQIYITDNEWKAIQAGAITNNRLKEIISNADKDRLKQLAMPNTKTSLSTAQVNRILNYRQQGVLLQDIANQMGISTSMVSQVINDSHDSSS